MEKIKIQEQEKINFSKEAELRETLRDEKTTDKEGIEILKQIKDLKVLNGDGTTWISV